MPARTGAQYLEALRDGRQVWQGGRRIEDVSSHPGFVGAATTLARLYDRQHQATDCEVMTAEWEGERISYSYLPPIRPEHVAARRRNTEFWADQTLGYMGRFPDFCAHLAVGLLDAADLLATDNPRFAENARRYHRHCALNDLCLTHALNDQYYDRSKSIRDQPDPDLIVHVVRETEDGPIVRGLRNLATLAPLSDEALVHANRPRGPGEEDYALSFAIPLNAPGLTILCRDLYAEHADPERLPLSARFDEVDATLIFDDVLVPWERVFVYRNPALAGQFHRAITTLDGGFCTGVRLLSKLEAFVGVADLLTQWSGRSQEPQSQALLGQLIADAEILRACLHTAETDLVQTKAGYYAARMSVAYRLHGIDASDRAERILEDLLTSSLVLTGGASDLASPEIGPYVERFFRNQAPSTRDHLRLLAVAADMVQTSFAARQQLYERLQSGEPDNMRRRLAAGPHRDRLAGRLLRFIHDEWEM
jgi:4-hydroxyphenylacetate 3-monooxygenase/anthranilate 3-monooxygenase (FAD)/4-hydroxyphenylacetate 3-monooxygenase